MQGCWFTVALDYWAISENLSQFPDHCREVSLIVHVAVERSLNLQMGGVTSCLCSGWEKCMAKYDQNSWWWKWNFLVWRGVGMRASLALSGVAFGADLPLACGKTSTTGSSAHSSYHPSSSAQVLAIAKSSSSSSGSSPSPGCSCPDFCQYVATPTSFSAPISCSHRKWWVQINTWYCQPTSHMAVEKILSKNCFAAARSFTSPAWPTAWATTSMSEGIHSGCDSEQRDGG